jgi:alkylation response protein AidB-like acyl-CoA dehydrogenase
LPQVEQAYGFPHGRLSTEGQGVGEDNLAQRRWVVGAALLTGLCLGAIELVSGHVKVRRQFGQPLAAFEAIQFPLAECVSYVEGMRLCVIDAAWRASVGDDDQMVAAALAWISCDRFSRRIADVCHQSMGASGFCDEIGLTHYTWAIAWLRLSVGKRVAQRALLASRQTTAAGPPPSLVLPGCGSRSAPP